MRLTRYAAGAVLLTLVVVARPTVSAQAGSAPTIAQFLSPASPIEVVAARKVDRVAWIAYDEGKRNVYTAAAPGFAPVRLTKYLKDDGVDLTNVRISADGSTVVFVRGSAANRVGWHANPSGDPNGPDEAIWAARTAAPGLSWRVVEGSNPQLSPDGRWVLVVKNGQIYRAAVSPTKPATEMDRGEKPFINEWGTNSNPVWSPHGTGIAFVSNRGDHSFVTVYHVKTRTVTYLAPSVDFDTNPVWSADNTHIVFTRRPGTPFGQQAQAGGGGIGVPPGPAAAGGVTRPAGHVHTRELETIFGTVTVTRVGYGAEGEASLHPLDGQLNLPVEKYSHEVRRRVALEAAKGAFEAGVETLATYTGAHVPKRQFEELVVRAAQDFDAFYQARHAQARAAPATGPILVLTVDGKGVVMRPEDLREATQKAAATRATTFTARLGRGRRLHAKRMAAVAAVYTIAPFVRTPEEIFPPAGKPATAPARPAPEHKRVWASLTHPPEAVIAELFDEAQHRDPRHRKRWVALVDGNETQIDLLGKQTVARHVAMPIVVDFIHVAEYIWDASRAFAPDPQACDAWVLPRLREILRGKASDVAAGMRRSATLRGLAAEDRKLVDVCADYLLKYAPYLRYDLALAEGLPIATGVIEGACGHLVEDRMNLTGARWSLKGAEAVLRLRALRSSGDFDEYWRFHERGEYERNHAVRYADHHVPTTARLQPSAPPSRRHLKLVKTPQK